MNRTMFRPFLESNGPLRALLAVLASVALGLGLGLFAGRFPFYMTLLGAMLLALILAWWMFRLPQLTVVFFWVTFAMQATIVSEFNVQGFFYPVYLLMLFNALWALALKRMPVPWRVLGLYALFFVVVLVSLFRVATEVDLTLAQRLFIYGIGGLVLLQFPSRRSLVSLNQAQVWTGLLIAGWVIASSLQAGFENRGSVSVNENDVATILSFGLLPLPAALLSLRRSNGPLERLLLFVGLAFGGYALLILASRGVTVAFIMAVLVMLARVVGNPRRSLPLLAVATLAAVVVLNLPGGDNLVERFDAPDVASANGRLPLWQAAGRALVSASPFELLLGHGLDYSRVVVSSVWGFLDSIHNAYLQIALEFGLIGLAFFLALHFIVMAMVWSSKTRLALYALGAVTFLLFANLTATAPDDFLYWVALGHAAAVGAWVMSTERAGARRGRDGVRD